MRQTNIERNTAETKIKLYLNLDEQRNGQINSGVGFFDHMLTLWARHGNLTLDLLCSGDLEVDAHHTIEDCGIVLGKALGELLNDKTGLTRYGNAFVPMDEALVHAVVDLSGRGYLAWHAKFPPGAMIGTMPAEMIEEFFRAVAINAQITLHIRLLYGSNLHHMSEAIFKAFAQAIKIALKKDTTITGVLSTKGVL